MIQNYQLKQPAQRYARIGAFYAGLLPVMIGLLILIGIIDSAISFKNPLSLPIALGFVFGAPVIAWFSQAALAKRETINFRHLIEIALFWATMVHVFLGFAFLLFYVISGSGPTYGLALVYNVLKISMMLWAFMTIPLTVICCFIFKVSALRPIQTSSKNKEFSLKTRKEARLK